MVPHGGALGKREPDTLRQPIVSPFTDLMSVHPTGFWGPQWHAMIVSTLKTVEEPGRRSVAITIPGKASEPRTLSFSHTRVFLRQGQDRRVCGDWTPGSLSPQA